MEKTNTSDRGISTVIGVVLMVAVAVIIAAVVAGGVLSIGDKVSKPAPQESFNYHYNESAGTLTLTKQADKPSIPRPSSSRVPR